MEIEENWDQVRTVHLPCGDPLGKDALVPLVSELPLEQRASMERFISGVFQVLQPVHFVLLACWGQLLSDCTQQTRRLVLLHSCHHPYVHRLLTSTPCPPCPAPAPPGPPIRQLDPRVLI